MLIQPEYYADVLGHTDPTRRRVEDDTLQASGEAAKGYEDEEMWNKGW